MCPGMRPATGWMPNFTSTPRLVSASYSSRTLCCACATAMPYPGTITTLFAADKNRRGFFRGCAAHSAGFHRAGGRGLHLSEGPEQHVGERAVHRLRHVDRQDEARRAIERARHDQQLAVEHETHGGRRQSGVGIQQRDHRRHVGAADRNDHHHAEDQRDHDHCRVQHSAARDQAPADTAITIAIASNPRLTKFWPL